MEIEEYIYRKQNNICVICGEDEMYDEENDEFYCPNWDR